MSRSAQFSNDRNPFFWLAAGEWMGSGVAGEQPTDQRFDDGQSLCFDSAAMSERIELLGAPELE